MGIKHGNQRNTGGNDSKKDLACAEYGSDPNREALCASSLDIFQHHDGVVDDQSGRQHDGQQRQ